MLTVKIHSLQQMNVVTAWCPQRRGIQDELRNRHSTVLAMSLTFYPRLGSPKVDGQTHGENGRMPISELILDSSPLWAPSGYYVHLLQTVDFDGKHQYSLPLLNQDKERISMNEFGKFWELATKLASQDKPIAGFRQLLGQAIAESSRLERKLDS